MSRGRFNDERGRGSPRGGRGGRGRGRGRGGYAPSEVEHEAVAVMAELGIPYHSARGEFRGGRGFYSGGRGTPNQNYSPRGRGSQTPNYYSPRGRGSQTPNGRGSQTPNGRGRARGGGIGFRQNFDDSAQPPWARGDAGRAAPSGPRDRADRPLLKPVKFVSAGVLFEDKDDIMKAEALDAEEDPEQTVEWLDKTFERAVAVATASEHVQGSDTPAELALDDILMQATKPGIILPHEQTTKVAISTNMAISSRGPLSPPPILADKAAETDSEEEQIVWIPTVLRSHMASKAPSPSPPPEEDVIPPNSIPVVEEGKQDSAVPPTKELLITEESVVTTSVTVPDLPATPPPAYTSLDVATSAPVMLQASSSIAVVPTLESFSLSPGFGSSTKKKKLARKEIKLQRRAERRKRSHMELGMSPRVGDSDLEWGSDGPPEMGPDGRPVDDVSGSGEDEGLSDAIGAMEIDEDVDVVAMQKFLHGLHAPEVTINDLNDAEKIKKEDAEADDDDEDEDDGSGDWVTDSEDEEGSEEEVDAALREGERELLGESDDDDDDDDDESDEAEDADENEAGPSGGFQARLNRAKAAARENAKKKGKSKMNYDEEADSDDEDALFNGKFSWADKDEKFLAEMQDILVENADILEGRDRKTKKMLFNAIRDGNFRNAIEEEDDLLFASKMVKKGKQKRDDVPVELQGQWDKDRAKKADYKRARALARKQAELDPFKGGKRGKKGLKKRGKPSPDDPDSDDSDDSDIAEPLVPITDMTSLEQNIRVFLQDLGKTTMVLPPMDKESRRRAHLLAEAFSIKSQSKGKGVARFPVFVKTTRSGVNVDERKVQKIVLADKESGQGSGQGAFYKAYYRIKVDVNSGGKGTREGDIVGAKAAKISDSNVGYKMLQLMGWAEGDRIGQRDGGIVDPLTAVIKRTKLGLGAAK